MGMIRQKKSKAIFMLVLAALALLSAYVVAFRSSPLHILDPVLFDDVSFDANGGAFEEGAAADYRACFWEAVSAPEVRKEGYVLLGWVDTVSGAVLGPHESKAGARGAWRACWALDRFKIDYDLAYGEIEGSTPSSYSIRSDGLELPTPTRYAYDFVGWSIDGVEGFVDRVDPSLARDITVHAAWTPSVTLEPSTVYVGDELDAVPYVYCYGWDTAPVTEAGIWLGVGSVTDNEPTYYIGHNPGIFAKVANYSVGSLFAVCDDNGAFACYRVVRQVTVLHDGTVFTPELEAMVMPQGEYASLQTCRLDNIFMDIYVGRRIDG